jgi:poly(hydroxyalkanoate) depolymerase family esterase
MVCRGRPLSAALALPKLLGSAPQKRVRTKAAAKRVPVPERRATSPERAQKPAPAKVAAGSRPGNAKGQSSTAQPARRPAPGTMVDGRFTCPTGALAYKLYTPAGSPRRRLPMVVMLHGCTQSANDFAAGTDMNALADELGFLVLYPEQSTSANLIRCWNWHRAENQRRGSGEAATIAGLTREIIDVCKANPARVYIAGISAGGAAAGIIAAAYPDIFVAAGVHSALAHGKVTGVRAALAAMKRGASSVHHTGPGPSRPVPMIIFHGDRDKTVHPYNADGFVRALRPSSPRLQLERTVHVPSGRARAYTRTLYTKGKGLPLLEEWIVHGAGHAWSGGNPRGSYTDPAGPNASRAMMRFFLARKHPAKILQAKILQACRVVKPRA